jgi:hypothetical protein
MGLRVLIIPKSNSEPVVKVLEWPTDRVNVIGIERRNSRLVGDWRSYLDKSHPIALVGRRTEVRWKRSLTSKVRGDGRRTDAGGGVQ